MAIAATAVLALSLSACYIGDPGASSSPSASEGEGPVIGKPVLPSASSTPPAIENPTAVSIRCDAVVTPEQLYAFNPNFSLTDTFTPAAGTSAAAAVASKGVACGWINNSSNEMIIISIAQPSAESLRAIEAGLVASGSSVATFGTGGFFANNEAQLVRGGYWITASSNEFYEAADAEALVASVLANLKA